MNKLIEQLKKSKGKELERICNLIIAIHQEEITQLNNGN